MNRVRHEHYPGTVCEVVKVGGIDHTNTHNRGSEGRKI